MVALGGLTYPPRMVDSDESEEGQPESTGPGVSCFKSSSGHYNNNYQGFFNLNYFLSTWILTF